MQHVKRNVLLAAVLALGLSATAWSHHSHGETVNYWVEMSNLTNMVTRGIGRTTFKPGDRVTVNLHPLKDGRPGGSYVTITAADGKVYE
jgi:hypothetical protein